MLITYLLYVPFILMCQIVVMYRVLFWPVLIIYWFFSVFRMASSDECYFHGEQFVEFCHQKRLKRPIDAKDSRRAKKSERKRRLQGCYASKSMTTPGKIVAVQSLVIRLFFYFFIFLFFYFFIFYIFLYLYLYLFIYLFIYLLFKVAFFL